MLTKVVGIVALTSVKMHALNMKTVLAISKTADTMITA
jgi:hypothetical protein